jgi:isopenicillin N synthase-like dioxygenase
MSISVIDISPFLSEDAAGSKEVVRQWSQAFETTGFATITGHGVPEALGDELYAASKQFFGLPLSTKMRTVPPGEQRGQGYLPVGLEAVARTHDASEAPADICESLTFTYLEWERALPENEFDRQTFRSNVWPERPPQLKALVEDYSKNMYRLARTLMQISARALDLPDDYFESYYDRMISLLRLVNYPDQPMEPLPGQLRYGSHTDYTGFTILRQDEAPGGLQVLMPDESWVDVLPVRNSFVINAGDLLSRWTNGRWKSNIHRVANPPRHLTGSTQRISIVNFTGPNNDALIECLPSCQGPANPARYAPIRSWDHLMAKLRASMPEVVV